MQIMKKWKEENIMMKTTIKKIVFAFLLFNFTTTVNASIGTISISGATLNEGETSSLSIGVSSGLMSVDGDVISNDTSCIQIISGGYFTQTDLSGKGIQGTVGNVTIKAVSSGCSTTLQISNASINTLGGDEERNLTFTSGTITVNGTSQPTSDEQIQTYDIPANNIEENNNDYSYSDNQPSYSQPINEESVGSGSSNNFLSSLSVNGFELDKKFNTNTLDYSISVGADVEDITVNAKTTDSNAKVTIYGTNSLKSGKNTVSAVVIAENGSKRTYTIAVNKETNPNEEKSVKSKNNYLKELKLTNGVLSPTFTKEKTKYIVYLPFEETKLNLEGLAEDEKATVKIDAPSKLQIGNNTIKVEVTAEDGTKKIYTIIAKRGINPEYLDNKNTYLKSVSITSGKLVKPFKKEVHEYYYKGKLNITGIAEDENAIVRTFKDGDITYIEVEAPNGEFSIYTFRPYEVTNSISFKVVIFLIGFIAGFIFKILLRKICKKKNQKKLKKQESNS